MTLSNNVFLLLCYIYHYVKWIDQLFDRKASLTTLYLHLFTKIKSMCGTTLNAMPSWLFSVVYNNWSVSKTWIIHNFCQNNNVFDTKTIESRFKENKHNGLQNICKTGVQWRLWWHCFFLNFRNFRISYKFFFAFFAPKLCNRISPFCVYDLAYSLII